MKSRDQTFGQVVPPDAADIPQFPGQTIVDIQYSKASYARAIVTHEQSVGFRTHLQLWQADEGVAAWFPVGRMAHFSDTLERAKEIGAEQLAFWKDAR